MDMKKCQSSAAVAEEGYVWNTIENQNGSQNLRGEKEKKGNLTQVSDDVTWREKQRTTEYIIYSKAAVSDITIVWKEVEFRSHIDTMNEYNCDIW